MPAIVLLGQPAESLAQSVDILEQSPRTSIYIETVYSQNDSRPDCDWYVEADDYLDAAASGSGARDCVVSIRIRGTINKDGARTFSSVVERATTLGHVAAGIVLDSKGGDADAAISMGRLIRGSDVFSALPVVASIAEDYRSVCFSACVVLFAAAYERRLDFDIGGIPDLPSRIGIHGPGQFDRARGAYDSSASNTEIVRVSRRLKGFFESIDVDAKLVDDMFAVPFDEIRLLRRDELVDYGLYAN